jgi:NTE family protein
MSTYTNLVFQGGGVKGIAYAGALQVLESRGILAQIERVAGTSAGAITACLVSLRYDAAYITKTIKTLNFKSFEDKEWIWKKYWYYGFHPGDVFLNWLEKQIASAPQGLSASATFADFESKGCRDLHVFASDIQRKTMPHF